MDQKHSRTSGILRIVVTLLALANLAALFIFHYELPAVFSSSDQPADEKETTAAVSVASDCSLQFDPDPLLYDGSSDFDILSGVSLTGPDGQTLDNEIFAQIKAGDSLSRKTIEYTADTDYGRVSGSRSLELSGYAGPSITLPESMPDITETQMDTILDVLSDLSADDGYGNDITQSVTASYTTSAENGTLLHYTFQVTNLFNDTASVTADLNLAATKPIITLTADILTIQTGEAFSPLNYVDSAVDVDGSDLSRRIYISGTVDTQTAGTYTVTYVTTSLEGVSSDPAVLTVTVE